MFSFLERLALAGDCGESELYRKVPGSKVLIKLLQIRKL